VPSPPQIFVGAGDIAQCGGQAEATARLLDGTGGTVFTLGDNAYMNGTVQEFQNCYEPTWGRHKARTRPTLGNHDYGNRADATPYFNYFGLNAGPPGLGYYSFELGTAWRAISLNSEIPMGANTPQGAWLADELATHPSRCTVAFFHRPLYSSGPNRDNPQVLPAWRQLYEANIEIILGGHDHLYERFQPMDPEGRFDAVRGIRHFTVGTGGVAPLYQFVNIKPTSEVRAQAHGVLKLTLETDAYSWDFITVSGGVADTGRGTCH
jgi:hypothetical protein